MNNSKNIVFYIQLFVFFAFISVSCDKSEDRITISDDVYLVTSPQANDTVLTGIHFQIEWNAPKFLFVDIELYQGSEFVYTIEENIDVRSGYHWMPPDNLPEGSDYYIKISNSDNKSQNAISQHSFTIKTHLKSFSEFTDPLDGKVYKTTKIGDQWWMAENYSYDSDEGSWWWYNDRQQYESYGKMYTLETALKYAPPGWHLPTNSEWEELATYLRKSTFVGLQMGGGSGFNTFPSGAYTIIGGGFFAHGDYETRYRTSTVDDGSPVIRIFSWKNNNLTYYTGGGTYIGTYVRYVKDEI